jgi:hypothetical protein
MVSKGAKRRALSMNDSLQNFKMHDGSRNFATLPQATSWSALRNHLEQLEGLVETAFLTDHVTEAWLDFEFLDHTFAVNNQFGEYWFFVRDPECDEAILRTILEHARRLLG